MPGDPEQAGFAAFRDALSSAMIERLETSCTRKKKRPVKSTKSNIAPIIEVSETSDDAEILSDFVEVPSTPPNLEPSCRSCSS